jgi:hypothetical protein
MGNPETKIRHCKSRCSRTGGQRRDVVLLPRQVIEVWFVPERAIIRFGNLKSHHTVRDVGPSNGAIEAAKSIRHESPECFIIRCIEPIDCVRV